MPRNPRQGPERSRQPDDDKPPAPKPPPRRVQPLKPRHGEPDKNLERREEYFRKRRGRG
jgi:hypothetical protein